MDRRPSLARLTKVELRKMVDTRSGFWSQRTALVSFALVPERSRLIAAKVLAGVVLALAATVVAIVFAAIGTALAAPDIPHVWSLPAGLLGQDLLYVVTAMVIGIAFGAALLASAPAIVPYFGLPAALAALGSIHALSGTMEWVNSAQSLEPLTLEVLGGQDWAKVVVTLALWMVLPLAIGLWRIVRSDLS